MTKKQFLNIMGDIDDKFIKEDAAASNTRGICSINDAPHTVYLTDDRIPFWKIAVSAAAVICALTVTVYAINRSSIPLSPNDSDTSYSDTQSEDFVYDKLSAAAEDGYGFDSMFDPIRYTYFKTSAKKDDENYAAVYIEEGSADEEEPLVISITRRGSDTSVSEEIYVTDSSAGVYRINYTEEVENGERLVIRISSKTTIPRRVAGKWLP